MKCIIIDDEATARAIIEKLCVSMPKLEVSGVFSNAIDAIKYLNETTVDLILLDIPQKTISCFQKDIGPIIKILEFVGRIFIICRSPSVPKLSDIRWYKILIFPKRFVFEMIWIFVRPTTR